MAMLHFWAQSGPFTSNFFFSENLLMGLVSFVHAYLHAKNQSQILIYWWNSDDLRILKYHWLRAIFAFTWEVDFSQACSFLRMLMNHENFILHKFLAKLMTWFSSKVQKPCFLAMFDHFYLIGIFSKKYSCHTQLYMDP